MTAPGPRPADPSGPGVSGRIWDHPTLYPATVGDRIAILDHARAVILDHTAVRDAAWRDYHIRAAAEFTWPAGTLLEVDARGAWHASLCGVGCRWSSFYLPDVHDMITRAVSPAGGR